MNTGKGWLVGCKQLRGLRKGTRTKRGCGSGKEQREKKKCRAEERKKTKGKWREVKRICKGYEE